MNRKYDWQTDSEILKYRNSVPEWSDAEFNAAVEQAADNNHEEDGDDGFFCHLGDIVEGRIPNSYFIG